MPSPKRRSPRIQVTLSEEALALLEDISKLTGQGKATLASELVESSLPALHATREALKVVKDAPREAQRIMSQFSAQATAALMHEQLEFDDLLSQTPAPKRKKRRPRGNGAT